jgi:hypothetical protein
MLLWFDENRLIACIDPATWTVDEMRRWLTAVSPVSFHRVLC